MLCQMHPFICNKFPMPTKSPALTASRAPFSIPLRSSISKQQTPNSPPSTQSLVAVPKILGFRPTPELGFVSHFFVLSMAFGAFFSVAVVSIPTVIAFGRLGASVKKLSKVVSEEVPGTLSSLKLSSMELNDLTQQLSNLRHRISGVRIGKKDGSTASSKSFHKKNMTS